MTNYTRILQKVTGLQITAQTTSAEVVNFIGTLTQFQVNILAGNVLRICLQTLKGGWEEGKIGDYIINGGVAGVWIETAASFAALYTHP